MAHAITQRKNGFSEMAYVGEKPWHGLGQQLVAGAPIEQWQVAAGMDWNINRSRVRYATAAGQDDAQLATWNDYHVLMRSDTAAPLGMVSDQFKVVQPQEVLEFFRDLVDVAGFQLETAGTLFGGKKFWALANINAEDRIVGNDLVKGRLLLATACDGSMRTIVKNVAERVVCNNTLRIAMNESGASEIGVTHRTTFDADAVKKELGVSVDSFRHFISDARQLASRVVGPQEAQEFMAQIRGFEAVSAEVLEDRGFRKMMELFEGAGAGSMLQGVRGTAWGLVNAVTQYVDHEYPARTDAARLNHAWFGRGDAWKVAAMKQAVELLK